MMVSVCAGANELPCEVSWVGNDWGGRPDWVLQDIDDLFVTPEGDVFTHVGWEEGGGNVMRFDRDGAWKGAANRSFISSPLHVSSFQPLCRGLIRIGQRAWGWYTRR
jgi:hypothetical protein